MPLPTLWWAFCAPTGSAASTPLAGSSLLLPATGSPNPVYSRPWWSGMSWIV